MRSGAVSGRKTSAKGTLLPSSQHTEQHPHFVNLSHPTAKPTVMMRTAFTMKMGSMNCAYQVTSSTMHFHEHRWFPSLSSSSAGTEALVISNAVADERVFSAASTSSCPLTCRWYDAVRGLRTVSAGIENARCDAAALWQTTKKKNKRRRGERTIRPSLMRFFVSKKKKSKR